QHPPLDQRRRQPCRLRLLREQPRPARHQLRPGRVRPRPRHRHHDPSQRRARRLAGQQLVVLTQARRERAPRRVRLLRFQPGRQPERDCAGLSARPRQRRTRLDQLAPWLDRLPRAGRPRRDQPRWAIRRLRLPLLDPLAARDRPARPHHPRPPAPPPPSLLPARTPGAREPERVNAAGTAGNDDSFAPVVSNDGRLVSFDSIASNLVSDDTNNRLDVFVRDRQAGTTRRVSVGSNGEQGDLDSLGPAIDADGQVITYYSDASTLVPESRQSFFAYDIFDR